MTTMQAVIALTVETAIFGGLIAWGWRAWRAISAELRYAESRHE